MSYILDALRKSEQERQTATGQSAGMLFPIEIQRDRKPWLPIIIIILVTFVTGILIWWMWTQPAPVHVIDEKPAATLPATASLAAEKSATVATVPPAPLATQVVLVPPPVIQPHVPDKTPRKNKLVPAIEAQSASPPNEATPTAAVTPTHDPLKGMPSLNITGYLHDEQGGSVAMINNQLIHEGEEVLPGLRLVKILDGSAIFSYKGYVFSR